MTDREFRERMRNGLAEYRDHLDNLTLFDALVTETQPITTWKEFERWVSSFEEHTCFRGQREATWILQTTFDRRITPEITAETDTKSMTVIEKLHPDRNEKQLLREFQRAAHHYYAVTPEPNQTVDWFALMQHHGAPTRMLDWTRSPYIALYFAIEKESKSDSAIWTIDLAWLRSRSNELLRQHDQNCPQNGSDSAVLDRYINEILLKPDNPDVIVQASPMRLNERMLIQQGELLCNLRHGFLFFVVLLRMLIAPSQVNRCVVSKTIIKRDQRIELLEKLRLMNIHQASLFPGLDGFARSLGAKLDVLIAHQSQVRRQEMTNTMLRTANTR